MKKTMTFATILLALLLSACSKQPASVAVPDAGSVSVSNESGITAQPSTSEARKEAEPAPAKTISSSKDAFHLLLDCWKADDFSDAYEICSSDVTALMNFESFSGIFRDITDTFGKITEISGENCISNSGIDTFTANVLLERAVATINVSVLNNQIAGTGCDIRFVEEFDKPVSGTISEHYFLLENGAYKLNAVYTDCGVEKAPVILLIPGSGPSDYNETVGILPTFGDFAHKFAEAGFNTLRIEKRTYRYGNEWTDTCTPEDEYFSDFEAAINWIKSQKSNPKIYLFGHSLGVQIAPVLATRNKVDGFIMFNGTARHLADILADQYTAIDPANKAYYVQYAEAAKAATSENVSGLYYYGTTDYYWADYNKLSTIDSLIELALPTLIINSEADTQVFASDRDLWVQKLGGRPFVNIMFVSSYSHFGYEIDTNDPTSIYKDVDLPNDLIEYICKEIQKW